MKIMKNSHRTHIWISLRWNWNYHKETQTPIEKQDYYKGTQNKQKPTLNNYKGTQNDHTWTQNGYKGTQNLHKERRKDYEEIKNKVLQRDIKHIKTASKQLQRDTKPSRGDKKIQKLRFILRSL